MKGYAGESFARNGYEIAIYSDKGDKCYTLEFIEHDAKEGQRNEVTFIARDGSELLRALSEALQALGMFPKSAVEAELKATKYHLEDFRKLIFEPQPKGKES